MAYQINKRAPGAQILRTPAPDVVSSIRNTSGESGYGQSASPLGNATVTLPPGKGGPQSLLGQNLRESVDDPVADAVLAKGIAGRDDQIPADGPDDQLRSISAKMYPPAHGAVRQQDPDRVFGKATKL